MELLRAYLTEKQYSPLLLPASLQIINQLPLLGSGKTDYVRLQEIAEKGGV
jgi:acyl-[acyl-carrier-protein]-phospholipid O-acyltransferase/long-chain-fatty-acid--[acyl-carrier-protein] ligase